MWWVAAAIAGGWAPDDLQVFDSVGAVTDAVHLPEPDRLVVLTLDAVTLHDRDGGLRDRQATGGHRLLLLDGDLDGVPDLYRCGPTGVHELKVVGDQLGPPRQLDPAPCDGLALAVDPPASALVAWSRGRPRRIGLTPGSPSGPVDLRLDAPVVATGGGVALGGTLGSGNLVQIGVADRAIVPTGGRLTALADGPSRLWAFEAPATVHLGEEVWAVDRAAVGLAAGPARGHLPVLAWSDKGWLLPGPMDLPLPDQVQVSDWGADGCDDLLMVAHEQVLVVHGACPATDPPPPMAGTATEEGSPSGPVPNEALPHPPDHIELAAGAPWPVLSVFVDGRAEVTVSVDGHRWRGQTVGGPPSLRVVHQRIVVIEPTVDDVGRWPVTLHRRIGDPVGIVVDVWPRPLPGQVLPDHFGRLEAVAAEPPPPPPPTESSVRPWTIGRCELGAGLALGGEEEAPATEERAARFGLVGSPAFALLCPVGPPSLLRPMVGVDAAPWFHVRAEPHDRAHLVAATVGIGVGGPHLRAGPYGSLGVAMGAVGLRAHWLPTRRSPWGAELRGAWFAPAPALQTMLLATRRW